MRKYLPGFNPETPAQKANAEVPAGDPSGESFELLFPNKAMCVEVYRALIL